MKISLSLNCDHFNQMLNVLLFLLIIFPDGTNTTEFRTNEGGKDGHLKPLIVITFNSLLCDQISKHPSEIDCKLKITSYCYHSVNVIKTSSYKAPTNFVVLSFKSLPGLFR